jgi:FHS family glucose/mannose:H+ symporter-like MFS transporter
LTTGESNAIASHDLGGGTVVQHWKIRLSLALNFAVFAILLNTVGIVIKRVIDDYGVGEATAASLEACKDLSIAGASFLLASYIPRLGYRRSMLAGLLAVTLASILVAVVTGFWATPVLYMAIGVSFSLMKGAVYSTVGLITRDQGEHTSLMNVLEGVFQVGALLGPLFFSFVLALHYSWRQTYWMIAVVSAVAFVLLLTTPLDESEVRTHLEQAGFVEMLKLLRLPAVWVFVLCAWLYVMIEQSFGTWLPTFHERVFGLSPALAAGLLSLYAGSIALSRFLMGYLSRRFSWLAVQLTLLAGGFLLTLGVLLLTVGRPRGATIDAWSEAPALALAFSCMGFFIGPIYPTIVSIVLGRLEKARHPAMTGLIIVFSALGGTTGSFIVGFISRRFNTHDAFFYPLLPMILLGLLLVPYRRLTAR